MDRTPGIENVSNEMDDDWMKKGRGDGTSAEVQQLAEELPERLPGPVQPLVDISPDPIDELGYIVPRLRQEHRYRRGENEQYN